MLAMLSAEGRIQPAEYEDVDYHRITEHPVFEVSLS